MKRRYSPATSQMMGMLLPLGIEKGKEFKPDAATVALLKAAAAEAHAWLMDKAATDVTPWWPGSQWVVPSPPITMPTGFKWEIPNYFDVDSRGHRPLAVFLPNGKARHRQFLLRNLSRSQRRTRWKAANNYRLHVPANVPVREFWSVTVYSLETSSFFLNCATAHARFARQGLAEERRRHGGRLLWPEAARRSGVQLALHPARPEVVSVVPRVWPGEGDFRQELEVAGH